MPTTVTYMHMCRSLPVCHCRHTGQVGYLVMGMRNTKETFIGDTFHHSKAVVVPLPGFSQAKPMVIKYKFS